MNQKQSLEIFQVPVSQLRPAVYNPRKMSAKQELDLTKSLKRFGFVDPIIVNNFPGREMIVIGGHQRLIIATKLNYETVPVVYVNLDEIKEKELNLRLNANTGEWDFEVLKEFDLDILLDAGLDDRILSPLFDDVLSINDDIFKEKDELEKAKTTNIKEGDLFQLGDHRLLCGDSLSLDSVEKLMDGEKADMIYTDPIYNIGLDYNKGIGGKGNYGGNINDNKNEKEYQEFIKTLVFNSKSVAKLDAHFFFYCDQKYVWMLQKLYQDLEIKYKRTCIWVKNGFNLTPNIAFNKAHEPVIYGVIGKPYLSVTKNLNEILNRDVGNGNRAIEDIVDMIDIWLVKRQAGIEYEHPTSKPPSLHEKPLKRCTRPGDIVLDLCAGSGSTLIACEQLKRKAYVCDIEKIFCQLIINRWECLTGKKAILLTNINNYGNKSETR